MYTQIFLTLLILFPLHAFGDSDFWNPPRRFSAEAQYATYSDIVQDEKNPLGKLADTVNLNVDWRIHHIFSLVGMYGTSAPSDWSYYGLGFKMDLPGFFFIGTLTNDFVRQKKMRRVNTSITYAKMSVTQTGNKERFVDDKLAFAADIFVAGNVYLNLEAAVLSHKGNQFFAPAVGLGYEF